MCKIFFLTTYLFIKAKKNIFLPCFFLLFFTLTLKAQNDSIASKKTFLIVKNIEIQGNKRTKDYIILRELNFKINDTLWLNNIEKQFQQNENNLYNTRLFNETSLKISYQKDQQIDVTIHIEERWYIFPAPVFEIEDRNLNVWWNEHHRTLKRASYGIYFFDSNFRGRREQLNLLLKFGFSQRIELSYRIQYLDKKQKHGITPYFSHITEPTIAYSTQNNSPLFFENSNASTTQRLKAGINYNYRPNIYENTKIGLSFHYNQVTNDSLLTLNPFFYGKENQRFQQYPFIAYTYTNDHRNWAVYPLKGYFFATQIQKIGIGFLKNEPNIFSLSSNYTNYFNIYKNNIYGLINAKAKITPFYNQGYNFQRALGYGFDYIRGYEYKVIDGQNFAVARTAAKFKIVDTKIKNNLLKIKQLHTIPIGIYLKSYAETAYVHDRYYAAQNPLANKWLSSAGVGIDVFTLYDILFSFEYTFTNKIGNAFFFSVGYTYDIP